MSRLTEKVKGLNDYIKLATKDKQDFINKLGKLEDILQAFNIESLEELTMLLELATTSEELNKELGCPLEKIVKALALLKPLFQEGSLKAGQYIDWDNPCIMVKDIHRTDNVIAWYRCSEEDINLLNEVMGIKYD